MTYGPRPNAQHYQSQQILNASAAEQVVMLYDGAIKFCLKAKEAIAEGNIQNRHNNNKRAMEIVSYLQDILDPVQGGDIAKRLQIIYTFLLRRLLEVDFRNDPRICDEVIEHLKVLRGSWEQIANQDRMRGGASSGEGSSGLVTAAVA